MAEQGSLTSVQGEYAGTETTASLVLGLDVIPVEEATAVAVDTTVWIGETTYLVTEIDEEAQTITIEPGLVEDIEEAEAVAPDAGGQPYRVWTASVVLVDGQEPIEVPLTAGDLLILPEGIYDPPVGVTLSDDLTEIIDVPGRLPTVDGALVDPGGLDIEVGPDGLAPAFSPTPTVEGTVGALLVRWTPVENADPVVYEVHISTNPGFVPDGTTLAVETAGSSTTIRSLPGSVDPLSYDVIYYLQVIAKDEDGPGPASGEDSGSLVRVNGPDIAVEYAYVGRVLADQIDSGTVNADLLLAATIRTGVSGARVENGPDGIVIYNSAGDPVIILPSNISESNPAIFRGEGRFEGLTADGVVIQGPTNEIAAGGVLELAAGVSAPKTSPSIVGDYYYDNVPVPAGLDGYVVKASTFSDGKWYVLWVSADGRAARWHEYTVNGDGTLAHAAQVASHTTEHAATTVRGGVRIGSSYGYHRYVGHESKTEFLTPGGTITLASTVYENELAMGTDGTDVFIAYVRNASGTLRYRVAQYSGVNAAFIANHDLTGGPIADKGLYALYVGNGDLGSKKFVLTQSEQTRSLVFDFTSKAYEPTKTWIIGGSIYAMIYNGVDFWTISSGGLRLRYETGNADVLHPESPEYWHVGYTFYDNAGTPHETALSPAKMIAPERRARYKLTAEDIPVGNADEPNAIRWYVAKTTTNAPPARTSFKDIATVVGSSSLTLTDLVLGSTSPPDPANNPSAFPESGFGRIKSPGSLPNIDFNGDGTWELGPLGQTEAEVAAGTVHGMPDFSSPDSWHIVGAAGETPWLNGWSSSVNLTLPMRFIKDPSGYVTVSGIFAGGTARPIFNLPEGYRPVDIIAVTTMQGTASTFAARRVDISPDGEVGLLGGDRTSNFTMHVTFPTF